MRRVSAVVLVLCLATAVVPAAASDSDASDSEGVYNVAVERDLVQRLGSIGFRWPTLLGCRHRRALLCSGAATRELLSGGNYGSVQSKPSPLNRWRSTKNTARRKVNFCGSREEPRACLRSRFHRAARSPRSGCSVPTNRISSPTATSRDALSPMRCGCQCRMDRR